MLSKLKKTLYFPLAYYFRFFAKIRLAIWKPYIIVVTGSSGKTTLLHLIEAQVGDKARYSHHANSSYGIPFDILGLQRKSLRLTEWAHLFLIAPLCILKSNPKHTIYIVEADCDRPNEGRFLATLLKPRITLWTNSTKTHSMNFDSLVRNGKFKRVEEAIAYEYGHFARNTQELIIVNGDSENIKKEIEGLTTEIFRSTIDDLKDYKVSLEGTEFNIKGEVLKFKQLLPQEVFCSLSMCVKLLECLKIPVEKTFEKFTVPPGRNSVFKGIKDAMIIDSSYNANLDSMRKILHMFENIDHDKKWMIIGDMLEQGESEKEEHERLAEVISKMKFDRVIFIGPRVSKYTYPKLEQLINDRTIEKFENPKDVLDYLNLTLKGEELLLFKGARFLEGVIENLLADKNDAENLARREKVWHKRRRKFGL